ncbi:MAG: hypothetical protein AAB442_02355 [Patescibacteria group bacterium]
MELRVNEQPAVLTSERVTGDVYLFGGSATVLGDVTGDVVAGGGTVTISGKVGADIFAGGGNVTILSDVGDDVRVGGGNVVIQGKVGGDLIVGGGQVSISGSGIGGDVVMGAGMVRIDAPVEGSLKIGGGNVYINAPIRGTVTIEADKVTLGPSAILYQGISYRSVKELIKEDGAEVRGEVEYTPRASSQKARAALFAGLLSAWILGKFLVLLTCALVLGLVFRKYSKEVVARATERPLSELGRGLLAFITLPIVSVLLLVTVLGIPFGIFGLIGFFALVLFSWIVAPILIGSVVSRYVFGGTDEVSWKTILLGTVVITLIGFIPLLGWVVHCVTMLISAGAIVAIKLQMMREWR